MIETNEIFILNAINLFRTLPTDASYEMEHCIESLHSSKRGKIMEFALKIRSNEILSDLKISSSLVKLAELNLHNRKEGLVETERDTTARTNRLVVGYTEVHEIYHVGSLENFYVDIFCSEEDPKQRNKSIIFNSLLKYAGVAVEAIEDLPGKFHICIAFCDKVIEDTNAPLDEQMLDAINIFRKYPTRKTDELADIVGGTKEFYANLKAWSDLLYGVSHPPLLRHKFLDEVAQNIFEKIISKEFTNLGDEHQLADIAENMIHGFNKIHFTHVKDFKNTKDAITLILGNFRAKEDVLKNSRKTIAGKSMKYCGIYYESGKSNNMIIVSVDNFYQGSKKEYHIYFEEQLNRLRIKPESYIPDLKVFKKDIKIKTYKGELIKNLSELIDKIKFVKPIAEIKNNQLLNKICKDYMHHRDLNNKLYREEEEFLKERLAIEFEGFSKCEIFIGVNTMRPENFITELLVSEHDIERQSRKSLLSGDYKYFGCCQDVFFDDYISIIVLVDEIKIRPVKTPSEETLEFINLIRTHPRCLIKYVRLFEEEIQAKLNLAGQGSVGTGKTTKTKQSAPNKQYLEKLNFLLDLKKYLLNCRLQKKLQVSNDLRKAIEDRVQSDEAKVTLSNEALREYLKEYVNNTFYCSMLLFNIQADHFTQSTIRGEDIYEPGRAFVQMMIDNLDLSLIKTIHSIAFRKILVEHNEENSTLIVFLCDHAVEKIKVEIPLDHRQIIKRPNFTDDEIEQIRNDFNKFDILEQSFIRPDTILTFMQNSYRFINNNPIYYAALKSINTVENNELGVNVNQFMDSVAEVISKFNEENWENIYNMVMREHSKRSFDKNLFYDLLKKLNYKLHESEAHEMFERLNLEQPILIKEDFIKIMMMSEKGGMFTDHKLRDEIEKENIDRAYS